MGHGVHSWFSERLQGMTGLDTEEAREQMAIEDGKLVDRLNSRGRSDVSKKVVGASDIRESRDESSYTVDDDRTMVKGVSGPNIAQSQRNLEI